MRALEAENESLKQQVLCLQQQLEMSSIKLENQLAREQRLSVIKAQEYYRENFDVLEVVPSKALERLLLSNPRENEAPNLGELEKTEKISLRDEELIA